MPTPNMSDEELDALFRRGAAAYPDDVHLGAWSRMEEKLNAATTARLVRQKVVRLFAAEIVAVALLLGLWQGYHRARPTAETARRQPAGAPRPSAAPRPVATITVPIGSAVARLKEAPTAATTQPATAYAAPKATASTNLTYAQPANANQSATESTANPERPVSLAPNQTTAGRGVLAAVGGGRTARRRGPTAAPREQATVKRRAAQTKSSEATGAQRLAQGPATTTNGAANERRFAPLAGAPGAFAYDSLASLSPALLLGTALRPPGAVARLAGAPIPAADSAAEERPRARVPYRLVVGVLGAPSVSAVRSAGTARLGADFGLTLEYRLTARLRLRASLLSSEKRYRAASTDYQAPAAWQWFPGSYDLDANCRITEIPLDLRYDVLVRPTYSLFTSLGVNSLLMRDERYSYDWVQNGQTMTTAAHVVNGSNHVLSVLNFSVGLERPLGGRWSAQAEPYWQVPLGGVGAGRVRLNSAGLAFSLKYGLFR